MLPPVLPIAHSSFTQSIYLLLHKFLLYQSCGPSCSSKHWYDAPAAHDPIARSHAGSRSIAHYAQNNLQTDELTHIRVDIIKWLQI